MVECKQNQKDSKSLSQATTSYYIVSATEFTILVQDISSTQRYTMFRLDTPVVPAPHPMWSTVVELCIRGR